MIGEENIFLANPIVVASLEEAWQRRRGGTHLSSPLASYSGTSPRHRS